MKTKLFVLSKPPLQPPVAQWRILEQRTGMGFYLNGSAMLTTGSYSRGVNLMIAHTLMRFGASLHILISHVRACMEAAVDLEEVFFDAVGIDWSTDQLLANVNVASISLLPKFF